MKTYIKNIDSYNAEKIIKKADELGLAASYSSSDEWLNSEIRRIAKCSHNQATDIIALVKSIEQLYDVKAEEYPKDKSKELSEYINSLNV